MKDDDVIIHVFLLSKYFKRHKVSQLQLSNMRHKNVKYNEKDAVEDERDDFNSILC